jgi:quercetin dioxygenase-like cupin family protein
MRTHLRSSMNLWVMLVAGVTLLAAPSVAQGQAKLKWGPAPAVFPKGAKMAVVSGDPSKAGQYVVQLSMPNKYRIAPHFHPTDENVLVKSGEFSVGMGDKVDTKAMKTLKPGEKITAAANAHHYAMATGKTVVEVSGMGPFMLTYVKPADDPTKKK